MIRTLLACLASRNVDSIVRTINRQVDRLDRAAESHDATAATYNEAATRLRQKANVRIGEAARARRVAHNFRQLTK